MARTESVMLPLGTKAPDFELPNVITGANDALSDLAGDGATLIMFICNHCPYVKHVQHELVHLGNDYKNTGLSIIAISSNDVENYPDDAPDKMRKVANEHGYPFPYLYDESQEVAKAYKAACTPDFFLFDGDLKLAYRGQLDASRPGNDIPVTGESLRTAINQVLKGEEVTVRQIPSLGCNIKWKE